MEDKILEPEVLTWEELSKHWWSWVLAFLPARYEIR